MPRPRAAALLVAVWLVGAVLATGTGLLAVRLVADQVGDEGVTTLGSLDAAPPVSSPPATPGATPTPTPPPSVPPGEPEALSAPVTFQAAGGTVGAQCRGETPVLLYATPAPGYALGETEPEGGSLRVRFRSQGGEGDDDGEGGRESRLEIGCRAGTPVLTESED